MKPLGDLPVFGAGGIELRHAVGQVLLLLLEFPQVVEHGHALREYGTAGEGKTFLGKVSKGNALLGGQDTGIESLDSGQHLQE